MRINKEIGIKKRLETIAENKLVEKNRKLEQKLIQQENKFIEERATRLA